LTTTVTTLAEALGRGLPADRLVLDPDVLAAMSHDEAEWAPAEAAAIAATMTEAGALWAEQSTDDTEALFDARRLALDPRGLFNPGKG
jgi:FAD/FMN-containing dehydrogenase